MSTTSLLSSVDYSIGLPSNLSSAQQKLLHLHQRLGHLHMKKVQDLVCLGSFGHLPSSVSNCELPLCKACLHGKQHKSSITSSTATGIIDALHLTPGDCISGDQVESSAPGMVPTYCGIQLLKNIMLTPFSSTMPADFFILHHTSLLVVLRPLVLNTNSSF
jgi:hypothetical protein